MFGIGKKLAGEAVQQAESAAQVAVDTVNQTVQQAAEQAKAAGQKGAFSGERTVFPNIAG
ncbi:hypothetical protein DV515_00006130 [Chloebia gouldiae]|uniref:Adipogenesis regulatory factor n=1 Tax=Chloebia gouldiae TaxID=44316 RepID=A0A3L8SLK7_CHLGU|nr:hypothetical protein DV515_00006130 [Chloebia gouldiae]